MNEFLSASFVSGGGTPPRSWVVSDGKIGSENQALALAERLGLQPVVQRVRLRLPWRWLSPPLTIGLSYCWPGLSSPPPQIAIGSGRHAVPVLLALKQHYGAGIFTIQMQAPRVAPSLFDAVVPHHHDGLVGANVFPSLGTVNLVTPERLAHAAAEWHRAWQDLPRPWVAVLVGGRAKKWHFTSDDAQNLAASLRPITQSGSLLISLSRRTGQQQGDMLRREFAAWPNCWCWDGARNNPYYAMLALADYVAVTADSVSMLAEAATAAKPLLLLPMRGGSAKFSAFHNELRHYGALRDFSLPLPPIWSYPPLDEAGRIASEITRIFQERTIRNA